MASGRSGAPKLIGGSAKEREEHREFGLGLTGARAAAWRPGHGGGAKRSWELDGEGFRRGRGEEKGSVRVVFTGPGEHRGGVARVNAGVNGFNAIEDGGRGDLRGEIRGGNDGGVVTARWHPSRGAGWRGWPGGGGGAAELGRPEVRDGADSRGPLDRETREKRPARKARTKWENVLP
jgi:hypothetical protein